MGIGTRPDVLIPTSHSSTVPPASTMYMDLSQPRSIDPRLQRYSIPIVDSRPNQPYETASQQSKQGYPPLRSNRVYEGNTSGFERNIEPSRSAAATTAVRNLVDIDTIVRELMIIVKKYTMANNVGEKMYEEMMRKKARLLTEELRVYESSKDIYDEYVWAAGIEIDKGVQIATKTMAASTQQAVTKAQTDPPGRAASQPRSIDPELQRYSIPIVDSRPNVINRIGAPPSVSTFSGQGSRPEQRPTVERSASLQLTSSSNNPTDVMRSAATETITPGTIMATLMANSQPYETASQQYKQEQPLLRPSRVPESNTPGLERNIEPSRLAAATTAVRNLVDINIIVHELMIIVKKYTMANDVGEKMHEEIARKMGRLLKAKLKVYKLSDDIYDEYVWAAGIEIDKGVQIATKTMAASTQETVTKALIELEKRRSLRDEHLPRPAKAVGISTASNVGSVRQSEHPGALLNVLMLPHKGADTLVRQLRVDHKIDIPFDKSCLYGAGFTQSASTDFCMFVAMCPVLTTDADKVSVDDINAFLNIPWANQYKFFNKTWTKYKDSNIVYTLAWWKHLLESVSEYEITYAYIFARVCKSKSKSKDVGSAAEADAEAEAEAGAGAGAAAEAGADAEAIKRTNGMQPIDNLMDLPKFLRNHYTRRSKTVDVVYTNAFLRYVELHKIDKHNYHAAKNAADLMIQQQAATDIRRIYEANKASNETTLWWKQNSYSPPTPDEMYYMDAVISINERGRGVGPDTASALIAYERIVADDIEADATAAAIATTPPVGVGSNVDAGQIVYDEIIRQDGLPV